MGIDLISSLRHKNSDVTHIIDTDKIFTKYHIKVSGIPLE